MTTDGRAVARNDAGKVTFVEGALPNEVVTVELTASRARYDEGRVLRVVEASPDRVAPPCPRLTEGCGGCQWQHVSPAGQRRLKEGLIRETLERFGNIPDVPLRPTVELGPWEWRTTMSLGVVGGRPALRKGRSHDLVPVAGCLIAHPLLAPLLEGRRYRGARTVVLRCGARTGSRMARTVPIGATADVPEDVGRDGFVEEAAGRRWTVSATSFFQSRPDGADALGRLVSDAAARIGDPTGWRAVDLYSGVGLLAGVLAGAGWSVTAVEGSRRSVADAKGNLSGLDVDVVQADVTRWPARPATLTVADPSRAGLGPDGVRTVTATGASRVVLVSCDVASLGRDCRLLTAEGYELGSVTAIDMFPHTWHVEVVSVFDRAESVRRGS